MAKKLSQGEMTWMSPADISVIKWKEQRDVRVISNAHKPEMVSITNKRG